MDNTTQHPPDDIHQPPPDDTNQPPPEDVDMNDGVEIPEEEVVEEEKTRNDSGGLITVGAPPRRGNNGYIMSTRFAPTYRSTFILERVNRHLQPLLSHVNCSYLSTPGIAPSLLQLKQHVQSLTILIKHLSLSSRPGVIDNANHNGGNLTFVPGETYDWLNDLTEPYQGPENPAVLDRHHLPLTGVMNVLEDFGVEDRFADGTPKVGVRDKCPLHHSRAAPVNGPSLPYATHQALIYHANEALELLDHEYSATGGLLSILPPKSQKEDWQKASSTVLGQLILYVQSLVERLHTLERQYANSLDCLASEALVPHQALTRLGSLGRKGREMVYPQDRFVLVNAGDDVWSLLDREFIRKARIDKDLEALYRKSGAMGAEAWKSNGAQEAEQGITAIDITTRYYRLRNDPLKTIFIIPAHQAHPGVKVTREMEKAPTVVSVVKPVWPERFSDLEKKNRAELAELKVLRNKYSTAMSSLSSMEESRTVAMWDNRLKDAEIRELKKKVAQMTTIIEGDNINRERLDLYNELSSISGQRVEITRQQDALAAEKRAFEADKLNAQNDVNEQREDLELRKTTFNDEVKAREDAIIAREVACDDRDKLMAEQGDELNEAIKAAWKLQYEKTQVLQLWLAQLKVDYENDVIPTHLQLKGYEEGRALFQATLDEQRL